MKTEDYSKYYIQGSDHYLIPKDEFVDLNEMVENLEKENKKLKDQLENCYCNRTDCIGRIKDSKVYDSLKQKTETQQKEFIRYLQEELNVQIQEESIGCEITNKRYILEEILQKYKEIIGE